MQRWQAFKFQLQPNSAQERQLRRFAGACRFVYNEALVFQKARYERGEKKVGYAELCKLLTQWRNSAQTPWLRDAPTHPLQQALQDLERAYKNFFAQRAGFPKFKKRGQRESFRYPDPKQFKLDQVNGRLFLPKLGWMRLRLSRAVLGAAHNATVSLRAGKWSVSIQTEREVAPPVPQATGAIGIDVGIARFATFSDGRFLAPLNSFRRHEARLRHAQRALSRKVKFSHNWKKAKAHVQRVHQYKLQWAGGTLIAVPPQNTSRECPECGCVSAANRLTQARFRCVQCLYEENADVVGAKNVLARGHRVIACGEVVSRCVSSAASSKQEPTEATEREATHAQRRRNPRLQGEDVKGPYEPTALFRAFRLNTSGADDGFLSLLGPAP